MYYPWLYIVINTQASVEGGGSFISSLLYTL